MQMPVIDASTLPHYADSRRSTATGTSGLGRGNIYVALDEAGQALGVQFPGGPFRYTFRGPGWQTAHLACECGRDPLQIQRDSKLALAVFKRPALHQIQGKTTEKPPATSRNMPACPLA